MSKLVVAVASVVLAMSLNAAGRQFAIDSAGFLVDTNRGAFATFAKAALEVDELDGKLCLPCRFAFVPGIGQDKCREINFSSASILLNKKAVRQPENAAGKIDAASHSPLPKMLQVDSLEFDVIEDSLDIVIVAKQGGGDVDSRNLVLYQVAPEKYFRYLCSSEAGGNYWRTKMLGKCVEYRIVPVNCAGDEYVVENSDIRSKYFSKMTLTYARRGDDFRLKKIVLSGDYSYMGGVLKSDPASLEMRSNFAESHSIFVGNPESGIVETGRGVLKSQGKVQYTVYDRNAFERFKVVIEICETT